MYLFLCVGIVIIFIFTQGNTLAMYLQGTPTTWDQAYLECEAIGMQLAVLKSKADYYDAIAYIRSRNTNVDNVWIGLKIKNIDTKLFEWINGEGLLYTNWLSDEPNYIELDSCVRLKGINLGFADMRCSTNYAFLCTDIKSEFLSATYTTDMVYTSTKDLTTSNKVFHTTTSDVIISIAEVYTSSDSVQTTWNQDYTSSDSAQTTWNQDYTLSDSAQTTWNQDYTSSDSAQTTWNQDYTSSDSAQTTWNQDYTSNKEGHYAGEVVHPSSNASDTVTPNTYITDKGRTIPGVGNTRTDTTIIRNIIDTITRDNTFCMCSCSRVGNWKTHNYTLTELKHVLAPVTKQLRQDLLIDKSTISAYNNKHISKSDSRKSSKQIGYVGMIIIILVPVAIVLIDIMTFCKTK